MTIKKKNDKYYIYLRNNIFELNLNSYEIINEIVKIHSYNKIKLLYKDEEYQEFIEFLIQNNIFFLSDKIVFNKIRKVNNDSLNSIEWLITSKCNSKCEYCIYDNYLMEKELNKNKLIDIANQIGDLGVINVTLSGGEPFLNENLYDIIKTLYDYNIKIRIDTNGLLLDNNSIKSLNKFNDFVSFSISLDSLNPIINNYIRGIRQGTKNLIENIIKITQSNFYTNISTVLTSNNCNLNTVTNLYEFIYQNEIEEWSIAFVRPFGKGKKFFNKDVINEKQKNIVTHYLLDISHKSENKKINFLLNTKKIQEQIEKNMPKKGVKLTPCKECLQDGFLSITPSGNVYKCLFLPNNISYVENLENMNLFEIYDHAKKQLNFDTLQFNECNYCYLMPICNGGCRGNALSLTSNLYGCDSIALNTLTKVFSWLTTQTN